jgi:hypothetical protein
MDETGRCFAVSRFSGKRKFELGQEPPKSGVQIPVPLPKIAKQRNTCMIPYTYQYLGCFTLL